MRQAFLFGVSALLISLLMPMFLLQPINRDQEALLLVIEEQPDPKVPNIYVQLCTEDGIQEILMEEYLIGVLLSEMPMSFELEALKAQAVAARTFTLRQLEAGKHSDFDLCSRSTCCQAWNMPEKMREHFGVVFDSYWEKAKLAVEQTEGEVLTYDGELIEAVYFSCSGGMTEDAVAVWGTDVPYLQSVVSKGEEGSEKFQSCVRISAETFAKIMTEENAEVRLSGSPYGWFGVSTLTNGGGIQSIEVGGINFSGTKIRELMKLNSTKFHIEPGNEEIIFWVSGYGHRVGMSQYGANAMAKEGRTYRDILDHYYTGVSIENYIQKMQHSES